MIFSPVLAVFHQTRLCMILTEIYYSWFSGYNHVDLIMLQLLNKLPSKCLILNKHREISFLLHLVIFYFNVIQAKLDLSCTAKYSEQFVEECLLRWYVKRNPPMTLGTTFSSRNLASAFFNVRLCPSTCSLDWKWYLELTRYLTTVGTCNSFDTGFANLQF